MNRLAALSPGELSLLRLIKQKGPMRLKKIQRDPAFHGWDIDSLKAAISGLSEVGMLTLDGDVLKIVHASTKVANRYMAEVVLRRFQEQSK